MSKMYDPSFKGISSILRNIQNDSMQSHERSSNVATSTTPQSSFVVNNTESTFEKNLMTSVSNLFQNIQMRSSEPNVLSATSSNIDQTSTQTLITDTSSTPATLSSIDAAIKTLNQNQITSLMLELCKLQTNRSNDQLAQSQILEKENVPANDDEPLQERQKTRGKGIKKPKIKIGPDWIFIDKFSLGEETYQKLVKNDRVQHYQMTSYINQHYPEVPCILKSYGKYGRSHERLTLRYLCSHSHEGVNDCHRKYKVFQMESNEFELYRNDRDVTHNTESKTVGQVRGEHRKEVMEMIGKMGVEEYLAECLRTADPELLEKGNLQQSISLAAAEKIRSEYLQRSDFDKDAIIDLLLMKIYQDFKEKDPQTNGISNYIRRIGLVPFFVIMFSDEQLKMIKMLGNNITSYIDATGSVVNFGEKKVFYYAGVTPDTSLKLQPGERHRVLPLFECISNAHDGFNIGILFSEYKTEFHKMFPTMPWPIKHAVTDFSYALLNSICWSWNNKKLIEYINCVYDALVSHIPEPEFLQLVETFIHICCCHIMKNFAKDVKEFFPTMENDQQTVLKEIFAGMFDIKEIQTLEEIWMNFSMLLVSKYVDDVEDALRQLCRIMVSEEQLLKIEHHEDHNQDDEIAQYFPKEKLPSTDEQKPMYKQSRFYQRFMSIMSKESFAKKDGPINSFYSPAFATMFLQKYITVLPLWTCFDRRANSYAEGHFKDTKKTMLSKQSMYGAPPLKPGRFIKLTEGRVGNVVLAMQQQIPRYRNTGQKRKAKNSDGAPMLKKKRESDVDQQVLVEKRKADNDVESPVNKRKKMSDMDQLKSYMNSDSDPTSTIVPKSAQISSLYKRFRPKHQTRKRTPSPSTQKRTPSPSTQKRNPSRTPSPRTSSQHASNIDDPNAEEQWNRRPKRKFIYFNKSSLKNANRSPTTMQKLLLKTSKKSFQGSSNTKKLRNGLIDQPKIYLAPQQTFIVARNNTKKLNQEDYNTLTAKNFLSKEVIDFVIRMLITQHDNKNIGLEISFDKFSFNPIRRWEENEITFFVNIHNQTCTLAIVNWQKKIFCCVDPQRNPAECNEIYVGFQKCVNEGNNSTPNIFKQVNLQHETITEESESAVAVINFTEQYLKKESVNASFSTTEYRLELQHQILRLSTNMSKCCILCGTLTKGAFVQCDCCNRWTHCNCIGKSEEELKDDTIHYFCIICVANTPQSELREGSNLTTILEVSNEDTKSLATIVHDAAHHK